MRLQAPSHFGLCTCQQKTYCANLSSRLKVTFPYIPEIIPPRLLNSLLSFSFLLFFKLFFNRVRNFKTGLALHAQPIWNTFPITPGILLQSVSLHIIEDIFSGRRSLFHFKLAFISFWSFFIKSQLNEFWQNSLELTWLERLLAIFGHWEYRTNSGSVKTYSYR